MTWKDLGISYKPRYRIEIGQKYFPVCLIRAGEQV